MTTEFEFLLDTYGMVLLMLGLVALIGWGVLKFFLGDCFKL